MTKKHKTFRFEIFPTQEQIPLLEQHLGHCRFVYNFFLEYSNHAYYELGESTSYKDWSSQLTQLKKEEKYTWLQDVNSQSLQQSLRDLEKSYKNFFSGRTRKPKFKKKHKSKLSFRVPQNVKIESNRITLPKFREGIKVKLHRQPEGKICFATITKESTGRFFASICFEIEIPPRKKMGRECGIDLGLIDFVVISDETKEPNHRYLKQNQQKLKQAQRHLSRKKKGSRSFENQRRKVAKIHEKVRNSRKDHLHKVSRRLVDKYDLIGMEDLNVKGMMKNKKLSKHIADVGWGMFVRMLEYKADWAGTRVVKAGRFFPSSKLCSHCGEIHQELTLSEREWKCPSCGQVHDRDVNAAINILKEAKRVLHEENHLGVELIEYTDGEAVSPSF